MIEAGFEFEGAIEPVVMAFASLPAPLRPVYFSHKEKPTSDADLVDDKKRLVAFIARSQSGFFLLGPMITYSVRIATGKSLVCDCFLNVAAEDAEQLLKRMSEAKPLFGFACAPAERERRNRVTTRSGVNKIESWVGRDTEKYVPGFYWLTLLPDTLAERHGVPLASVGVSAQEHVVLGDGQHLFRFYDRPEGWEESSAVKELCASLPGVFDIEKVKQQLAAAKNLLELNSILRTWQ